MIKKMMIQYNFEKIGFGEESILIIVAPYHTYE